jgi:hypothetical protein
MTDQLRIDSVQIERSGREPTPGMRSAGVTPYHLTVTITNTADSAVRIASTPTQLFYDAEHRALNLRFAAHDKSGQPLDLRYAVRRFTVEPGGQGTVEHDLYSPISFAGDPFHGFEAHDVDLATDVESIDCSVEFDEVQSAGPQAGPTKPRSVHGTWTREPSE